MSTKKNPKKNTCIQNQIISFSIIRFINKLAYNPAGEQYTHPGHSPAWQQQTRGFALQHPPCSGLVKGEADASFTKDSLPPSISAHYVLKHTCAYAQTFSKRAATPLFLASLPAHSNNNRNPLLIQTGIQFHSLHFFFFNCSLDTHTSTQSHRIHQSFYNMVCLTTHKHTARRANQSNFLS